MLLFCVYIGDRSCSADEGFLSHCSHQFGNCSDLNIVFFVLDGRTSNSLWSFAKWPYWFKSCRVEATHFLAKCHIRHWNQYSFVRDYYVVFSCICVLCSFLYTLFSIFSSLQLVHTVFKQEASESSTTSHGVHSSFSNSGKGGHADTAVGI